MSSKYAKVQTFLKQNGLLVGNVAGAIVGLICGTCCLNSKFQLCHRPPLLTVFLFKLVCRVHN